MHFLNIYVFVNFSVMQGKEKMECSVCHKVVPFLNQIILLMAF